MEINSVVQVFNEAPLSPNTVFIALTSNRNSAQGLKFIAESRTVRYKKIQEQKAFLKKRK